MSALLENVISDIVSDLNYYPLSVLNITARHYRPEAIKNKFSMDLYLDNYEKADEIHQERQLVEAALAGDFNSVGKLLKTGVSVDAVEYNKVLFYASRNYMTPLQVAAARGNWECVHVLIEHGADVNAKDRFDVTAMHMSAEKGHFFCLKALLDASADCSSPTKFSRKGYYTAIPYLGGTTPLHLASANNRVACVKELIQYGADYNAVDERGRTGLYIAAQAGFDECVLAQLKNAVGRDILSLPGFETGDTPLHFAVRRGMVDCVRELLRLGSDVNHVNYAGNSPLHIAVISSTDEPEVAMEILQLLVLNGYNTDVNLTDALDLTPLHYVSFNSGAVFIRRPQMAKFLISYGANVHIRNHRGITLLEHEYNSSDSDMTILKAVVYSLAIPPLPSQLKGLRPNSYSIRHMPMAPFYAMWLALRRGLPPVRDFENFQFQAQQAGSELHSSIQGKHEWYKSKTTNPLPLLHYCRSSIRSAMGYKRLRQIKDLPVPVALVSYLLLEGDD